MKRGIVLLLFFLFFLQSTSQELLFERPSNLLNLPSNETYNIIQDKQGYIWFSTDAGLCKYNGNKLKIFSKAEGLPEESCYGIACDSKGIIYVITSENRLLKIINDSIYELNITKKLAEAMNKEKVLATDFKLIEDSIVVIGTQFNTYTASLQNNTFKKASIKNDKVFFHFKIQNNNIVPVKIQATYDFYRGKREEVFPFTINIGGEEKLLFFPDSLNPSRSTQIVKCYISNKDIYIAIGTVLLKINNQTISCAHNTGSPILALYVDSNENVWVGHRSGGIALYEKGVLSTQNKKYALKTESVTGITEDKDGGIWCSTLEKGVFYCQNTKIQKLFLPQSFVQKSGVFKCINENLFFTSLHNPFIKNEGSSCVALNIPSLLNTNNVIVNDVINIDSAFLFATSSGFYSSNNLLKKFIPIFSIKKNMKSVFFSNKLVKCNERIYSTNNNSLYEIKNNKVEEYIFKFKSYIKTLLTKNKELFIAAEDGIYLVNQTNFSAKLIYNIEKLKKAIINSKNEFVILTKNENIIIKSGNTTKTFSFPEFSNIKINDLCAEKDCIWLATNKGIIKIETEDNSYKLYNSQYGLPLKNFYRITHSKNNLYVGTGEEIFCLNKNWEKIDLGKINLKIKQCYVNNKSTKIHELNSLFHSQNNIQFIIEKLNYRKNPDGNKIYYKIDRLDETKQYTLDNNINISNLNPGKYTLVIYESENSNKEILKIPITINKPFWLTWWFFSCCFLLIIFVIYFAGRKYAYYLREKDRKTSELNMLLNNYQMAAIRAQMNPHFIFNCINSIQRYILTNDPKTAYDYLTKFSRLIRLILNYSEENFISLQQELEIIDLYIRLEQLRFENVFEYKLQIDSTVDADSLFMPPMMLQPYIENAIWHGIMHLDPSVKGLLKIIIKCAANTLTVIVEDNGIGREASKNIEKKTHKSRAIGLNEQRIKALNKINNSLSGSIIIEDVLNEKNEINGTRVIINIPQENENNKLHTN